MNRLVKSCLILAGMLAIALPLFAQSPSTNAIPVPVVSTNGITGNIMGSVPETVFGFLIQRGELHAGAGLNLHGDFGTVVSQQLTLFNFGNTNSFELKNGPAAATFIYNKTEEQLGWSASWKLTKVAWLNHVASLNLSEVNGFVYAGLPLDEWGHPDNLHMKRLTVSAGIGWSF